MTEFRVVPEGLASAAPVIGTAARAAGSARNLAASVAGQEGAFGSEPIGAVFADMCGRAQAASGELEQAAEALSRNVAMASVGYLNTDRGVVSMYALMSYGFKP